MFSNDVILQMLSTNCRDYAKLDKMQRIEMQMWVFVLGIVMQQFKWEGLPKEIKAYNLEKILNLYGQAVVFKYGEDFVVASGVNADRLNIYGEPCMVQPIAVNGMSFERVCVNTTIEKDTLVEKNAVLIRNNFTSTPTYFLLKPFIEHLCFIWESKGINAGLSRIKAVIHANKNLASTLKTQIKNVVGSGDMIPVISDKTNILKEIEKLDFNVEYTPDVYWEDFDKTLSTICQLVGITTNVSQGKKERLIVSEVESNDELTTISEDTRLAYRKQACEEIKELFGVEWTCENKQPEIKPTDPNDEVETGEPKEEPDNK